MVASLIEPVAVNVENEDMATVRLNRRADDFMHFFKLLADDTRMRIVLYLAQHREMHVRALCKQLRQSQPAVSHHLALMFDDGLLARRRKGKHNYYRLKSRRLRKVLDRFSSLLPADERVPIPFASEEVDYAALEVVAT